MLLHIEKVLSKDELKWVRSKFSEAEWVDGRATAGQQSAASKHNLQIAPNSPLGRELSTFLLQKLGVNPLFNSAVLPHRVVPPLFNRYDVGMSFGAHVDNALRPIPGAGMRIRTDVSSTLFISEPDEYEGGELVLFGPSEQQEIKLPAGDMIVYPTTALHAVRTVTSGARLASFFWSQSFIRSQDNRTLLFEFDQTIQELTRQRGDKDNEVLRLTNIYHNLLRVWSEL
ncbi:Fe2+-dependent dioxygenase [Aristophania vespae]|uniref:Fe2+-dependent dioxygenase n=1 Tax=Aristophania vespae TaxID=2697033 RepID=A0A6P1NF24_9PROT|nr:Fe2+-dependent dioxygenase [Aristophania vespae]QHI95923.1 Fe2+-dependent dioxygenase [Aristophania vespae]UMM63658.1 PKHD-type hydroxylase [Aristophania vespae]